ncbi:hypothetical protein NAEGRDRAFT_30098, partial [Naegleria gruberi]
PSMIGRPKNSPNAVFQPQHEFKCHIGEELHQFPFRYDEFKPIISCGIVQDWDEMIILLEYCLKKVPKFDMQEGKYTRRVVLNEPLLNPIKNKQKWFEILFEYFEFHSLVPQVQPLAALYASGRTTGLVLDVGEDCTQILPVYDGYALSNVMNKMRSWGGRVGGGDLTKFVANLKYESGWEFSNSGREISKKIKERLAYVAPNYWKEVELNAESSQLSRTFELPDKTTITIDDLRFKCGEVLFRPSEFLGVDYVDGGIDDLLINTLLKSPIDCRNDFSNNIVLCGGTALMPGFKERLELEVQSRILPPHLPTPKVNVIQQVESSYLSWIGGAIIGSLGLTTHYIFSREGYMESGVDINRPYSLNLS